MKPKFSYARQRYSFLFEDEIYVVAPYSSQFVEDCRQIEGRKWHPDKKSNSFPVSSVGQVRVLADKYNVYLSPEIIALDDNKSFTSSGETYQVVTKGEELIVQFDFNPKMIEAIRTYIPSIKWSGKEKVWRTSTKNIVEVLAFAINFGLSLEPDLVEKAFEISKASKETRIASSALDADIDIPGIAIPLLPYQRAGVAYLKKVRKGILGDQPGLGKTAQAIATVSSENAFPVVVVCPNSLKINWEREVKKFFPNLTTVIVNGTSSERIERSDVVIINYDILYSRRCDLLLHGFKSLIVDESHAIKNGKVSYVCPKCSKSVRGNAKYCNTCFSAFEKPKEDWGIKRTTAVMELAKSLGSNDFVILLTGTPITNRPEELIPQLEAVGKLDKFGGSWRFKNRYAPQRNVAINTKELNERLRELCFVRRVKSDVYSELPKLRNAVQYLSIDNKDMAVYKTVEKDVIEYFAQRAKALAEEEGSDGTDAYLDKKLRLERAENLVRITALRNVVSKIKYDTIVQWIDNFIDSSDSEKVIVFAEHIEFVEELYKRYKDIAVKIRGGVSVEDRQKSVDSFQNDPKCRIFIANMTAASEGLTLTAASDVVFCELGWTPAIHEQCASRCYGRANDLHGATAWYLLAPHTIDEKIYELLGKKKKVVDAVTDGIDATEGGSIMDGLIKDLIKRGRH